MLADIYHVRLWVSINDCHIKISRTLNPLLYLALVSPCLSLEIHIFVTNNRDTTCRYLHDRYKCVKLVRTVWIGLAGSRCRVLEFKYSRIRLTEIEVDVRMANHRKVLMVIEKFSHCILLIACHVIEDKNRIWTRLDSTSLLLENV